MRQRASATVALAAALVLGGCTGGGPGPVVSATGSGPGRLLTGLSAQVADNGVVLRWEVDEARAHRITGFTCVYRTPGHLSLGVGGSVACGDRNSGADARERTVAGLPEYGEYLFEVTALVEGVPAIEWPKRALQVQLAVTPDHAGPAGPAEAVTGTGPVVFGCGPGDGPGVASAGRPWQQAQIVSAGHLFQFPAWGWLTGGDAAAAPEWPEPTHLTELTARAGVDTQAAQQSADGGGGDVAADGGAVAALARDDGFAAAVAQAAAGTKALLRPSPDPDGGWELRLHTGFPFGADYVYGPRHAVAGWGDPAHRVLWAELYNRVDCPPPEMPIAVHDVALALSDTAANGVGLEHSGYGWWAVAPVGFWPDRIVAAQGGLSFGDPAAAAPQAPAAYRGRVSGHLFWNEQRYALSGDLTLELAHGGGQLRLAGRIDNVVAAPLDRRTLEPLAAPPLRWVSLTLDDAPARDAAWSGAVHVDDTGPDAPPEPTADAALDAMAAPDGALGDWRAQAYGPDGAEIAGRLRLWTPLPEGADPFTQWPAQAVLVAAFAATTR